MRAQAAKRWRPHAQVLRVKCCAAGSHAREVLRDGDILLLVAGRPVTHFAAVDAAIDAAAGCVSTGSAGRAVQQQKSGSTECLNALASSNAEASEGTHFQVGAGSLRQPINVNLAALSE